jgi:beta-N-acetylhexosaminidase
MSLRELRRHVGRLAIVGFSGQSVPAELRHLVAEFDLGGVIYFPRNIVEPAQIAELSREVASLRKDWPLWISVDQEGGRVARLKTPFTEWPPAITLGRSGDERLTERFAAALADELAAVGINLDYAPVLDIHTNPKNPVIGDRAIGERADDVAKLGSAFIRAFQGAGIAACGKHFPGHGDTSVDSHEELPIVDHDWRRFDAVELVPFRRAIDAGVATIMTAHVLVPAVDERRPASMSPTIVQRWLKEKLGFRGVVFSDDLGMKAISATVGLAQASVDAIAAGSDVLLMCNSTIDEQVGALEAIVRAAESEVLKPTRLDNAFARQQSVKARFLAGRPKSVSLGVIGSTAHQVVASEMATWL